MAEIISFERPTPHMSGHARCIQCQHTWVATAPVGTYWLECPECGTNKGAFQEHCFFAEDSDTPVWSCECENQLFFVTHEGVFCPNCGVYQAFPES